ncbi:hypothetical protein LTS10_000055 [Elasticomyces elasticus]|nr:hypothetical protein LTS10_000055 [Elasticomyces elasticus]
MSDNMESYETTMDDFGEEFETLYLDSTKTRSAKDTAIDLIPEPTVHGRRPTSFLDLPGELRNVVYQLLLHRDRHIRIGFKYSGDLIQGNPGLGQGPKPIYHGIYSSFLIRGESGNIYRSAIKEKLSLVAQASPLLKREVLEIYYSENCFRLPLRNFLDRRLVRQWVAERGSLLKGVREVKLQMTHIRVREFSALIHVVMQEDGSVFVGTRKDHYEDFRSVVSCKCTFSDWVDGVLSVSGRHPEYAVVREMDVGPVMQAVIKICEAAESAVLEYLFAVFESIALQWYALDGINAKGIRPIASATSRSATLLAVIIDVSNCAI